MKYTLAKSTLGRIVILTVAVLGLAALSSARMAATTSVNIVNNSSHEIRNVYLSHVNADDWSGNQLGNSAIAAGQSVSLNVTCDQQQVKVIGEDEEGCFISTVVSCGANATWTITNDVARDCGGN
jgi:hypothetical protein